MFLRIIQFSVFCLFIAASVGISQTNRSDLDSTKSVTIKLPNALQAEQGDVDFTDGTNSLLRITDEGNFGAIEFKSGVPSTPSNKLYLDGTTLKFNGSPLSGSGATSITGLSDAIYDGSSLFLGFGSGGQNTGTWNTSIGQGSLTGNTNGVDNTAIGAIALTNNSTGEKNTAVGVQTLANNQTGSSNTAIGHKSLFLNASDNNTAVGFSSLEGNNSGTGNSAFGSSSLLTNTSGNNNIGIGQNSLYKNTSGSTNIGIGQGALYYNTEGNNNIGIGFRSNLNNILGSNNTIIGHEAGGGSGTARAGSVFLGYQAGFGETNSDRLYIDNSSTATPLIWGNFSSNLAAINGKLGIGKMDPISTVDIKSGAGESPLNVEVNTTTKLKVFPNGGTSIGTNSQAPLNGFKGFGSY